MANGESTWGVRGGSILGCACERNEALKGQSEPGIGIGIGVGIDRQLHHALSAFRGCCNACDPACSAVARNKPRPLQAGHLKLPSHSSRNVLYGHRHEPAVVTSLSIQTSRLLRFYQSINLAAVTPRHQTSNPASARVNPSPKPSPLLDARVLLVVGRNGTASVRICSCLRL